MRPRASAIQKPQPYTARPAERWRGFCTCTSPEGTAMRDRRLLSSAGLLVTALTGIACDAPEAPVAEVQPASPERPRMQAMSVVGCLQRGTLTDQPFVLLERS